jgi:hypothetical protein
MTTEGVDSTPKPAGTTRTRNYFGYAGMAIFLGYFLLATMPGKALPVEPGLDRSWCYAVNSLVHSSEYRFGRDVVFTFGPLGFIQCPLPIESNLEQAALFRLVVHGLWAALLLGFLWRRKNRLAGLIFIPAYLIVHAMGFGDQTLTYDYYLILVICALAGLAFNSERLRAAAFMLSGLFAGVLLFVKFSSGFAALLIVAIGGVLLWIVTRNWRAALLGWGAYIATVSLLAAKFMGSWSSFDKYFKGSLEMAGGYSEAMSLIGPRSNLMAGLSGVAVYLALLAALWVWRLRLRWLALTCAVAVFTSFKGAFVRQDFHVVLFSLFLPAVVSVLLLQAELRRERILCASAFALTLVCAVPVFETHMPYNLTWAPFKQTLLLEQGLTQLDNLIHVKEIKSQMAEYWQRRRTGEKLPPYIAGLIDVERDTVDFIPWEISYAPANDLKWKPMPTLQTYAAYEASLDRLNADHFDNGQAPDFVLVEYLNIDSRHFILDAPATWRSLLNNYDLAASSWEHLLLKRKSNSSAAGTQEISRDEFTFDAWVDVPAIDSLLYGELQISLRLWGKLAKTLYLVPPVFIEMKYESGHTQDYRLVPGVAGDGLLINRLPIDLHGLERLFACQADDRVRQFRIFGPGSGYYDDRLKMIWTRIEGPCSKVSMSEEVISRIRSDRLVSQSRWGIDPQSLGITPQTTLFVIDDINAHSPSDAQPIEIDRSREPVISMRGWAVDSVAVRAAEGVFVNFAGPEGEVDLPAEYGGDRTDVAQAFGQPNYRFSGFSLKVPTQDLKSGNYLLKLKVVTQDRRHYYLPTSSVTLSVR